ncbi:protein XNDC1N [Heteronotia binoei]|uniref:protein XNDC1N n=1 Tax=Heteronotia binoei TaxID=13085 RepID=UPI00292DD969|nr:protein XNDC1N [Heteronotia binoei]XP_060119759.1 protein XNDC1N [Heteronotia binoei]
MAPVKIKHVVSFTSQDPKDPVDNLLLEESPRPWLSCPHDRSRVLKAELQLEQASHIGYVDIGNCGSAFLQIDVGRSSWTAGQKYLTLLPSVTLMNPADAKLDKNRSGVRMFKEGDFLAAALGEKWDRVRLTCSQPFNKHTQFGLSFIRICTPPDDSSSKADLPSSPAQASPEPTDSPWLSSAAICRTFFPEAPTSSTEEVALQTRLQQLDPASSPKTQSPACLSRPARMVLQAATVRKRAFPFVGRPGQQAKESQEQAPPAEAAVEGAQSCAASGSGQESSARRDHMKAKRRRASRCRAGRSVAASSVGPRLSFRQKGRICGRKGRWPEMESDKELSEDEEGGPEKADGVGTCPICEGCFPADVLPAHASSCGEEEFGASAFSSPSLWGEQPDRWVSCPICQGRFSAAEVEAHASSCGESPASPPSWLWGEPGE